MASQIFLDNLLEILLSIILTFNIGAWVFVWNRVQEHGDQIENNSKSMNMVLNRIFGLDKDPTDEGHIVETEKRFTNLDEKLDEIAEMQKKAQRERREEHEEVRGAINHILERLSENDIDVEKEKL